MSILTTGSEVVNSLSFLLRGRYRSRLSELCRKKKGFANGVRRNVSIQLLAVTRLCLEIRGWRVSINKFVACNDTYGDSFCKDVQQGGLRAV